MVDAGLCTAAILTNGTTKYTMTYPASILPGSVTVGLTVICISAVGWAIVGAKRR